MSGGLEDVEPTRTGDAVMIENVALVHNAWSYAKLEYAYRRSDGADGSDELRKRADGHEKVIEQIAGLIDRLGTEVRKGWCSACFELTDHRKVEATGLTTAYLCSSCGSPTARCVAPTCTNMAVRRFGAVRTPRFCAEHKHEIPSFERATETIEALEDYEQLFQYDKPNLAKGTTMAAAGVLGAGFAIPAGIVAAPAIGGAIGSMFLGLNGAAAGSAGLALLGGGAVAAGGLGMVGGTYVVAAVGGALGSAVGMRFTNAYVGEDKSFAIELFRPGTGTPVILARGFTTEKSTDWRAMVELAEKRYPDAPIYKLRWGSKELAALGILVAKNLGVKQGIGAAAVAAAKAGKAAAKKLGPVAPALIALDLAKNPWHVAKVRADRTGVALAGIIARTKSDGFILVGHSLGARAMIVAAQTLAGKSGGPRITAMHTLGAAVGRNQDWRTLSEGVSGEVNNYHSTRDKVLQILYTVAQGGSVAVGRRGFGASHANLIDHDVSNIVGGHSEYAANVALA
ncbi:DUF726 domain-containing protein [Mycolicibacter virginiensis]|uniref:DUF726 domain-containing protein n=1 Tax=Mycolicibacter virginiensis TaxID=1795032 RepID=UPI001F0374B8|nr:DUF726 domain-containing protein [Mycolicibacter virginiensis]ULP48351.1 TMCO4 family protein [Mycolicibacter virginiensis]